MAVQYADYTVAQKAAQ
jgi:hypothetical protein